ncbi:hypothetical protein NL108_013556 [Boleophthalmus pectinirostris]|uniref:fMet-Leu-Phe receptor-like n=1 Tax=Boleophthalmus pectinirostris TaxID=150288 RepID=UPI000A1C6B07|nr:fMet-Leu-Phe receptor-like [Boleophthalmus pectinirostris]KAJ0055258.1 hypothetical protein NL108_013556 [Boleophthalmus pectinirostris]
MSLNASKLSLKSTKPEQEVEIDAIMDNISIILYTLTIVLGIPGNAMVIWVAGFKLKPKVTNVWLVNLAIADLIFCFTRISSLIKKLFFDHWPFGVFLCKFNGFFKYTNMFCSVFLLAVISLDRALCIWRPLFTKINRTLFVSRVVAVCVWVLALIFSTPYFMYRQVYPGKNNLSKCSFNVKESKNGDNSIKYTLYAVRFLCGFVLPFFVILICYIMAGVGIKRTRLSQKSRPLKTLVTLVIAFFLCWAPYHCLLLGKMVNSKNIVVRIWHPVASGVAYFNSCVNPILYYFMGVSARSRSGRSLTGAYKKVLGEEVNEPISQSVVGTVDKTCEETERKRSTEEMVKL